MERAICTSDFKAALSAVDNLEQEVGKSFWSLELRIFLVGTVSGLEAQKELTRTLKSDNANHLILRALAHYCSLRSEPGISWWRYDAYIGDAVRDNTRAGRSTSRTLEDYISYLLNFFGPHSINNGGRLLVALSTYPVIDLYEAVIRISQLQICAYGAQSLSIIQPLFTAGIGTLPDERISLIAAFLGIAHEIPPVTYDELLGNSLESYTKGDYKSCLGESLEGLTKHPEVFAFAELHAKSAARLGIKQLENPSILGRENILHDLVNVLLKTSEAERSADNIRKRVYSLPSSRYSAQLFSFLMREYVFDSFSLPSKYILYGDLNSEYCNPRIVTSIQSKEWQNAYLQRLSALRTGVGATASLFRSTAVTGSEDCELCNIEPSRRILYKARSAQTNGDLLQAKRLYNSLLSEEDYLVRQDAILGLNRVSADLGDYATCLRLLAEAYIDNPHIGPRLPNEAIIAKVEASSARSTYSPLIWLPILYEILSRTEGATYNARRDDAYEDFLNSHGASVPTALLQNAPDVSQKCLVYFLRFVCVPDVMDSSVAFRSTEDLLRERIGICQQLLELDTANAEAYSDEIKELTQRLIIQHGVREVEQSKIHVEVSGIRRTIEKSLKENYTRYIDLLAASPEKGASGEVILELGKILGAAAEQFELLIPANELNTLFYQMFAEVRDQFVSSNEYGLNGYLSTGLRHGTLAGQLRAPFEEEHLVTQRDEETKIYREPSFWLERFAASASASSSVVLSEALRTFSRELDELIDIVRADWIQITTESKMTRGLFDYSINDLRVAGLQSRVNLDTPYPTFVDILFEHLWEVTEKNLDRVRDKLEFVLKPALMKHVDALEHATNEVAAGNDSIGLAASITRARTSAQYAVDRIASWFRRAKTSNIGPYPLDLPISIAIAVVKNIFPNFLVEPQVASDSDIRLRGNTLTSLANVFFLLIDNVRKHCGERSAPVPVRAKFTIHDGFLWISVQNPIADDITIEEAMNKLKMVWSSRDSGSFEFVPKEGGSGLHKIKRIFVVELGVSPLIEVGIDDNRTFSASIKFPASPILT